MEREIKFRACKPDGRELKWVQGKPLGDCKVVITKCEKKGEEDGK